MRNYPTQAEIKTIMTGDCHTVAEDLKRVQARLDLYVDWRRKAGGDKAYYKANDVVEEMQREVKMLDELIRTM